MEQFLTSILLKTHPEFLSNMYHKSKTSLEDAKKCQYRMFSLLNDLKEQYPKNLGKIKSTKETLINAERFYNNGNNFIKAFENKAFRFSDRFHEKESDMSDKALPDWIEVDKKDLIR